MPAPMHKEKVYYAPADMQCYRYLMCCRRCSGWEPRSGQPGVGDCLRGNGRKVGNALSCDKFDANADGEYQIVMETARIDGDMIKVIIGDAAYYCTPEEVMQIKEFLSGAWQE